MTKEEKVDVLMRAAVDENGRLRPSALGHETLRRPNLLRAR